MALRGAITPRQAESRVNSSIISTNAVDKATEFAHMTRFGSLEPAVQCLHLAFFEPGHKFLAQEIDATQVLVLVHLRNLSLLYLSEFRGRQDHQERCAPRGKTPFPGL